MIRAGALVATLAATACGSPSPHPPPDLSPEEVALREELGIPIDAERVIFVSQSSHLDLDWQHTFDDYYDLYVEDVFGQAKDVLAAQPRATYSIAEMAFLQHHLAVHPEDLAPMKAAVARGALQIVGGGLTSPDTLLPDTELLARDFLDGIRFAEDELGAHPTAAWLPDSFGHGAAAPDLLAAAGYTSVGFSRIDGAPGLLDLIHDPHAPPLAGSTADELRTLGSADFVWRGSGGAAILAHYLAGSGLYCQGDNLDYSEPFEPAGGHLGAFDDSPAFTDASIDRYIGELTPYAHTRNLFVPVGCDFAAPKAALVDYLDGYDARRYPTTGVWAVAASFATYERFLALHQAELPVIDHELSPYFMGFYGSRAEIKRRVRDAQRPFLIAGAFATVLPDGPSRLAPGLPALALLARADHHDFVTGTSTDAVVADEQLPLAADAERTGQAVLASVAGAMSARIVADADVEARAMALAASSAPQAGAFELAMPAAVAPAWHATVDGAPVPMELVAAPTAADPRAHYRLALDVPAFGWQAIDFRPGAAAPPAPAVTVALLDDAGAPATGAAIARVVLTSAAVTAEWRRAAGRFALTSLVIDGDETVAGPSMIVRDYRDDGGLWRLGHEMSGCAFTAQAAAAGVETVQVLEQGRLAARIAFVGADATREVTLTAGAHGLDVAIETGAVEATTRTVGFTLAATGPLHTSVPGGAAERPAQRLFTPTFWAAVDWARAGDVAILLRQSTGVRMDSAGAIELMAVRDAREEACDVEGGTGTDTGRHRIEWRIVRAATDGEASRAAQAFDRPLALLPTALPAPGAGTLVPVQHLLAISGDVVVSTLAPAERAPGVILRVLGSGTASLAVAHEVWTGTAGNRVDLAERDLGPAQAVGGVVSFDSARDGSIASWRLPP